MGHRYLAKWLQERELRGRSAGGGGGGGERKRKNARAVPTVSPAPLSPPPTLPPNLLTLPRPKGWATAVPPWSFKFNNAVVRMQRGGSSMSVSPASVTVVHRQLIIIDCNRKKTRQQRGLGSTTGTQVDYTRVRVCCVVILDKSAPVPLSR